MTKTAAASPDPSPGMQSTRHEWSIAWDVDERQVPVPALLHAAYRFIDRCYVAVEAAGESTVRVTLVARKEVEGEDAWAKLVDDFEDEVAGEVLVQQVEANNIATMEFVMAQALGDTGVPDEGGDPHEDALEDPLGIAMSWEQRHERPAPKGPTDVPDEPTGETSDEPTDEPQ